MAITAAQLAVKVSADTGDAEGGLSKFGKLVGGVGIAAGATAIGIGVAAVKMAGDFQAGMTSLVTGAGESQKNIGMVSDAVLKMAVDTGTSTSQLTSGLYMIESAGYHGAAGLTVLKAAAEGAKVGNADLGTVADATTTILKDYPGVMGGATGAVNTLIATVANGKTHMQDLAGAMSQVLPTASAAGVGLNDVMGAMATMTGEGVPAANAATYLRQTIIALEAPSGAGAKALKSIGMSAQSVQDDIKSRGLPQTLADITEAVGKKFPVGSAAYVEALKNISGGSKSMQGILDLTGDHLKDFRDNTGKVADAANKSKDGIAHWSDVQNDFNFKMDRAREVVETLMISLGQHLLPVIGALVGWFTNMLPGAISFVTGAFQKVSGAVQNVIQFFQNTGPAATAVKLVLGIVAGAMLGMAASAVPAMIAGLAASVTAFGAQTVAAGAAAIATLAAAAPFLLVGAAIGAVIGVIILIVSHFKDIQAGLQNLQTGIRNMVENVLELLSHIPGPVGDMARSVLDGMKIADDGVKMHTLSMQVAADQHTAAMAMKAAANTDKLRQEVLKQLQNTKDPAIRHALEMKLGFLTHQEQMEKGAAASAEKLATEHAASMKKLADDAKARAADAKLGVLGHIGQMVDGVLGTIGGAAKKILDAETWPFRTAWDWIRNFASTLTSFLHNVWTTITNDAGNVLHGLVAIAQAVGGAIGGAFKGGINLIIGAIDGFISLIDKIQIHIPSVGVGPVHTPSFDWDGLKIPQIPYLDTGGDVQESGLAVIHTGERVLPAGAARSASVLPLPAGGVPGLASGSANGQDIYVTLKLNEYVFGQAVARILPGAIRNATGTRSF